MCGVSCGADPGSHRNGGALEDGQGLHVNTQV